MARNRRIPKCPSRCLFCGAHPTLQAGMKEREKRTGAPRSAEAARSIATIEDIPMKHLADDELMLFYYRDGDDIQEAESDIWPPARGAGRAWMRLRGCSRSWSYHQCHRAVPSMVPRSGTVFFTLPSRMFSNWAISSIERPSKWRRMSSCELIEPLTASSREPISFFSNANLGPRCTHKNCFLIGIFVVAAV